MTEQERIALGERIAAQALTYEGTPWFHTGRDRNGIDCVGLPAAVARDLGLTEFDFRGYSRMDAMTLLRGKIERFCEPATGEMRAGDVLLFRMRDGETHCGIALGSDWFIHAWEHPQVAKVVRLRLDRFWREKVAAVYRWIGEGVS